MATMPQPMPDQQNGAPQGAPSAAQASPQPEQPQGGGGQASQLQTLLAGWYRTAKEIGSHDPRAASGMQKVAQGIQEAMAATVTSSQQPQPTPQAQQTDY